MQVLYGPEGQLSPFRIPLLAKSLCRVVLCQLLPTNLPLKSVFPGRFISEAPYSLDKHSTEKAVMSNTLVVGVGSCCKDCASDVRELLGQVELC